MTNTIALLIVSASLCTAAPGAEPIRIATYNLNWVNRRGDQVLDAIETADPEIVCFQETTVQSERFLRKQLSDRYRYFHSAGYDGQYGAERFAFASRVKLDHVKFHPPGDGLFGFYTATFQHGGEDIRIVNVHLTPFLFKKGIGISGAMAAISGTEAQHAKEIEGIIKAIDPSEPTIIVGDFNSLSEFKAPKALKELGLIDSFAATNDEADSNPTWHWPSSPIPLALRIDYIFCTSHFRTVESAIIRREGSDHSLVVSELVREAMEDLPEKR